MPLPAGGPPCQSIQPLTPAALPAALPASVPGHGAGGDDAHDAQERLLGFLRLDRSGGRPRCGGGGDASGALLHAGERLGGVAPRRVCSRLRAAAGRRERGAGWAGDREAHWAMPPSTVAACPTACTQLPVRPFRSTALHMQIDNTYNKLQTLCEYIDDTEDYINIELDSHRNALIRVRTPGWPAGSPATAPWLSCQPARLC